MTKRNWQFAVNETFPYRFPEIVLDDLRDLADEMRYEGAEAHWFEVQEAADLIDKLLREQVELHERIGYLSDRAEGHGLQISLPLTGGGAEIVAFPRKPKQENE